MHNMRFRSLTLPAKFDLSCSLQVPEKSLRSGVANSAWKELVAFRRSLTVSEQHKSCHERSVDSVLDFWCLPL